MHLGLRHAATVAHALSSSFSGCPLPGRRNRGGAGAEAGGGGEEQRYHGIHMGVKRLMGYLRRMNYEGEPTVLKRGDTLVIDGSGWAYNLLETGDRMDHGGDYDAVHKAACRQIRLLRASGINLKVYKDGYMLQMKSATVGARREEVLNQYAMLHGHTGGTSSAVSATERSSSAESRSSSAASSQQEHDDGALSMSGVSSGNTGSDGDLEDSVASSSAQDPHLDGVGDGVGRKELPGADWRCGLDAMPRPRLLTQQLYATAQSAGVEVVACNGEADQDLAKASAEDPDGRTFVLGGDSDFFFFSNCRYIRFGTLEYSTKGVKTSVWTRSHLARLVNLSENQVLEWALLMGNDYTDAVFDTVEFHDVPEMMMRRDRVPQETAWWIRQQDPDFRLRADLARTIQMGVGCSADVEAATMALEFSRAFYNLEPLDGFMKEKHLAAEEEVDVLEHNEESDSESKSESESERQQHQYRQGRFTKKCSCDDDSESGDGVAAAGLGAKSSNLDGVDDTSQANTEASGAAAGLPPPPPQQQGLSKKLVEYMWAPFRDAPVSWSGIGDRRRDVLRVEQSPSASEADQLSARARAGWPTLSSRDEFSVEVHGADNGHHHVGVRGEDIVVDMAMSEAEAEAAVLKAANSGEAASALSSAKGALRGKEYARDESRPGGGGGSEVAREMGMEGSTREDDGTDGGDGDFRLRQGGTVVVAARENDGVGVAAAIASAAVAAAAAGRVGATTNDGVIDNKNNNKIDTAVLPVGSSFRTGHADHGDDGDDHGGVVLEGTARPCACDGMEEYDVSEQRICYGRAKIGVFDSSSSSSSSTCSSSGGGDGVGEGAVEDASRAGASASSTPLSLPSLEQHSRAASKSRSRLATCLDDAGLAAKVLERPWGNIALTAVRLTTTLTGEEVEDDSWVTADEAQTIALWGCALGTRKELPDDAQLSWRDIVIALNYQGHLWKLYREYRFNNPAANAPMPLVHFHGPTFHAIAQDCRRQMGRRNRKPESAVSGAAVAEPRVVGAADAATSKGGGWTRVAELLADISEPPSGIQSADRGGSSSSKVKVPLHGDDGRVRDREAEVKGHDFDGRKRKQKQQRQQARQRRQRTASEVETRRRRLATVINSAGKNTNTNNCNATITVDIRGRRELIHNSIRTTVTIRGRRELMHEAITPVTARPKRR